MPAPYEITPEKLERLIGTPDCPELVDISTDPDFDADPFLIPSAWRHAHADPEGLMVRLGGARAIVICQKGRKLSQGLAAWLRSEGLDAQYLAGGNHGWRSKASRPRVPVAALPALAAGQTVWVTRHRPKIDRIACPWLIRRFVDPRTRFLFVSPGEVTDVAERFGAIAFDIEGAPWSHLGDRCSFDAMVEGMGLALPGLATLADVVRAADTGRHDLHPAAAGLLAISVGLSRAHRDDLAQMEAGFALYDALYRWARDGQDETHAWPARHGDAA